MREYLEIKYVSFDEETVERFEIFRNCVYQSFPKADMCYRLSFKEAVRITENLKEKALSIKCSPDFWDTLYFRAREWSSR